MIRKSPLVERIERLHSGRMSGLLSLPGTDAEIRLHFYDGFIDAASSNLEESRLGALLKELEWLTSKDVARLLKQAQRKERPLGEILVEEDVLSPQELLELLNLQARTLIRRAVSERYSLGTFKRQVEAFRYPLRLPSGQVTLELARDDRAIPEVNPEVRYTLKPGAELSELSWTPQELAVLTVLREPRNLVELVDCSNVDEGEVRQALKAFQELGLVHESNGTAVAVTSLVRHQPLPLEHLVPLIRTVFLDEKIKALIEQSPHLAEHFKSLKVRLDQQSEPRPQIYCISSPHVEDGKSLVSTNLALCFGEDSGRRVLLLDCDLRRPSVHREFGVSLGPGLCDYLTDKGLQPHCYIRRVENIFLMTAGQVAKNPISLLALSRMKDLFSFLRQEFDTVVVDSPPFLPVADAQMISRLADAQLMVIRQGKTPYGAIQRALRAVDQSKFVGTILNDVAESRFNYSGYNYGYGSYYYYGVSEEAPRVLEVERKKEAKQQQVRRLP